ncbi:DUF317 domain-containing protein [Streptomyces luteogriseus]|uniref:DUF317 domain-containing protein n=1 Tax=Streptomyces luteogriseus TaxID=68233 RepID=UPI0037AA7FC5
MLTHPVENLDPAPSAQVLPRHLAGPRAVDPRAAWAFPFEEGWPFAQTEAGTAAAFGPCLRLQTTFDPQPDKPGKGTWTINAHRAPFTSPAWRITFDATASAEMLHDVHTVASVSRAVLTQAFTWGNSANAAGSAGAAAVAGQVVDAGRAHGGFGVAAGAAVVMTVLALGGLRDSSPDVRSRPRLRKPRRRTRRPHGGIRPRTAGHPELHDPQRAPGLSISEAGQVRASVDLPAPVATMRTTRHWPSASTCSCSAPLPSQPRP